MPKGIKVGGRKAGVPNKDTIPIRTVFQSLVECNLEQLKLDIETLKPADRIRAIIDLAKFCIPTLKAVDFVDNTPKEAEPIKIMFINND